jgi:hypothetical protein
MTSLRLITNPILRRAESYYDGRVVIKARACARSRSLTGALPSNDQSRPGTGNHTPAQTMIATRTAQMPRYRFTIRDHDSFDDEDGVILRDDLAARTHAIGITKKLRKASEVDWSDYTMEVIRDGRVVWQIPLEMASVNSASRRASS